MELIAIKTAITIKKYIKKEEHITQNCSEVIACNAKELFLTVALHFYLFLSCLFNVILQEKINKSTLFLFNKARCDVTANLTENGCVFVCCKIVKIDVILNILK